MREEEGRGRDLRRSSGEGVWVLGEEEMVVGGWALREEWGGCEVWVSADSDRDGMVHGVNVKSLVRCAIALTTPECSAVSDCVVPSVGNPDESSVGEDTSAKTSEEWLVALSSRGEKPCFSCLEVSLGETGGLALCKWGFCLMGLVDASAIIDGWVRVGFEGAGEWIGGGVGSSVHSLVGLLSSPSLKMKARQICSSSSTGERCFVFGMDGWALWFVCWFAVGSFPLLFEVGPALNDLVSSISSIIVKLLHIDCSSNFGCSLSLSRLFLLAGDRISLSEICENSELAVESLSPPQLSLLSMCRILMVDALFPGF